MDVHRLLTNGFGPTTRGDWSLDLEVRQTRERMVIPYFVSLGVACNVSYSGLYPTSFLVVRPPSQSKNLKEKSFGETVF